MLALVGLVLVFALLFWFDSINRRKEAEQNRFASPQPDPDAVPDDSAEPSKPLL